MNCLPAIYIIGSGLALSLILIPLIKRVSLHYNLVSMPQEDRWHKRPTPMLGGVGIFLSWITTCIIFLGQVDWHLHWQYLIVPVCAFAIFLLGLIDDISEVRPQKKLAVEIIAASVAIFFGFQLKWTDSSMLNMLLSFLWMVGITNAFNLLDNMDGLAAGIAIISGAFILIAHYLFAGTLHLSDPSIFFNLALMGALIGFLIFNFNPASIFMGDAGSLFIGFLLSILTIKEPSFKSKSPIHFISTVGMPILILLIPILDTTFVSVMRRLFRRPIYVGGKDHSSHRIVAIGFSERAAVLILYSFSIASGIMAILINRINIWIGIILATLFVLTISFFWIKLATVEVYSEESSPIFSKLSRNRKIFEVLLDLVLIIVAYYIAYVLRFESDIKYKIGTFIRSLPVVVATQMVFLYLLGIYKGIWERISIRELHSYLWAVSLGTFSAMIVLLFLYRFISFSRAVFIIYWGIALILLPLPRVLLYVLDRNILRKNAQGEPTIIYGAGIGGQITVKEIETNKGLGLKIVGFIDDNKELHGKRIMGYPVLGGYKDLPELIEKHNAKKIIISFRQNGEEKKKEIISDLNKRDKGMDLDVLQMKLMLE